MTDTVSGTTEPASTPAAPPATSGRARRDLAAVGLVASALLMGVSTLLMPPWGGDGAERLTAIHDAGAAATVSALTFTLAQLPLIVGVLGLGHLLRVRSPRLAAWGTALVVIGCFGHAVAGGISLVTLSLAADTANLEVHGALVESMENGTTIPFMAAGLLGTVLGLLLLSIALFRSRTGPRWVAPTLWAFLVVEFVGSNLSEWASPVSVLLYVVALGAIALTVHRSPVAAWAPPAALTDLR